MIPSPKPALERLQGSKLVRQGFGVKSPNNKGNSHISSSEGLEGQNDEMAPATGLEDEEQPPHSLNNPHPRVQMLAQDTPAAAALQSIISRWPSLPENIRQAISAIVNTVAE